MEWFLLILAVVILIAVVILAILIRSQINELWEDVTALQMASVPKPLSNFDKSVALFREAVKKQEAINQLRSYGVAFVDKTTKIEHGVDGAIVSGAENHNDNSAGSHIKETHQTALIAALMVDCVKIGDMMFHQIAAEPQLGPCWHASTRFGAYKVWTDPNGLGYYDCPDRTGGMLATPTAAFNACRAHLNNMIKANSK
jgi:hypothetical protein